MSGVKSILQSLCSLSTEENPLSQYLKLPSNEIPEVVVLYLEQRMSTDQLAELSSVYHRLPATSSSFLNLKEALEKAGSRVSVPFVSASSSSSWERISATGLSSLLDLFSAKWPQAISILAKAPGSTFLAHLSNKIQTKTPEQLLEFLEKDTTIYTNGVPDLMIVSFDSPKFTDHDRYIGSVQKIINAKTEGNVVSVFTADTPKTTHVLRSYTVEQITYLQGMQDAHPVSKASLPGGATPYNVGAFSSYFPIQVFEIMCVAALAFTIIGTGTYCLFSTQTPQKYETPKKARNELM